MAAALVLLYEDITLLFLARVLRRGGMMRKLQDAHPDRRDELVKILGVDPEWRMHRVSDGQRRRVQLLLGLVRPFDILLLDEVVYLIFISNEHIYSIRIHCKEHHSIIIMCWSDLLPSKQLFLTFPQCRSLDLYFCFPDYSIMLRALRW